MKNVSQTPHRKLIRPSLSEVKQQMNQRKRGDSRPKRTSPPDQTHAEAYYFLKQMQNRTAMVVVLDDGEQLRGVIEWYDRGCIKLSRKGEPNMVVYKDSIKYLYKADEEASERREDADGSAPNGSGEA